MYRVALRQQISQALRQWSVRASGNIDLCAGLAAARRLVGSFRLGPLHFAARLSFGFGLVLHRADHHDHVASVDTRSRFDHSHLGNILGKSLQQPDTHFGPLLFAAAELDHGLDLVASAQEAQRMSTLGLVVVSVDLEPETDFLQDRVGLVLPRLTGLYCRFILVLAKVHEFRHRRFRLRCHFDQIKVGLGGKPECVLYPDDPHLFARRSNQPYLGNADTIVDSWLANV